MDPKEGLVDIGPRVSGWPGLLLPIYRWGLWRRPAVWAALLLAQQALATVWFWAANIHDQLHATGHGENAATWIGGGQVFLMATAWLQYRSMRSRPSLQNTLLFSIQCASVVGSTIALSIFAYRRFYWSGVDTLCMLAIVLTLVGGAVWYLRRWPWSWRSALRTFVIGGTLIMIMAIAFRGVPRLFQGASLFVNNPVSASTVAAGIYIAAVRLMAVGSAYRRSRTDAARQAWYAELIGNAGSQAVLTVGWLLAIMLA